VTVKFAVCIEYYKHDWKRDSLQSGYLMMPVLFVEGLKNVGL